MDPIQHPITQFQDYLADVLDIEQSLLHPQAYFITDLGVDSVRMVEMMLSFERLGLDVAPELAWKIHTVGDAYRFYQEWIGKNDGS